ncbi:hypothetical protein LR48_Vigan10g141500 [Vigna angularis]|uniref:Uncharacterized protein n=1 Tax=Phaseolus angularis TaxID=3914 RepID=A0A0L9VKM6_PHAAN|nr:hypothetical protein LR48_Vigan10g141500 [Vigna angularis]
MRKEEKSYVPYLRKEEGVMDSVRSKVMNNVAAPLRHRTATIILAHPPSCCTAFAGPCRREVAAIARPDASSPPSTNREAFFSILVTAPMAAINHQIVLLSRRRINGPPLPPHNTASVSPSPPWFRISTIFIFSILGTQSHLHLGSSLTIFTNHAATTTNLHHLASFLAAAIQASFIFSNVAPALRKTTEIQFSRVLVVAQPPWQPSHATTPSRSAIGPPPANLKTQQNQRRKSRRSDTIQFAAQPDDEKGESPFPI